MSTRARVIIFRHTQGLTPGVLAFGERLRSAGHEVHIPDLFEARTFHDIPAGMAFVPTNL